MNSVSRSSYKVRMITRVGMLSSLAFILMYFQVPLTFIAPTFLKLDVSDLPVLVGSFTMGPMAAVLISLIKNILHFAIHGSSTGGIGELSNFIVGSVFAVSAGMIYKRNKTFKTAVIGLFVGTILMTVCALISNYYFIFPLYSKLMPMEAIINAGAAITSRITDLWSMMLYSVLPFNLIKGFIVSLVTLLTYKKVSYIFKD
ncbi:ECF transporter S component [Anaerosphaera multitolerans]|uniref:Riboflavin transporter n=1 Tax=Anaerosphaera multitolerans TaxID=2487351 RepID=A0A437S5L7_9FIRM|nr:ECF transporter S component [Anaerosphaera multitolerans]RVU54323.1 ECF transporter S component [Anaerosphaera multitolerans]